MASGATAWFDGHDGSGLQEIPSRIGAAVTTLGSTTGVDTNDPTWGSDGWTFDTTDDYMSSTADAPNITATTGKHTAIVVFTMPFNSNGWWWGSGISAIQRIMCFCPSAGQVNAQVRGTSAAVSATALTFASTTAGTKTVAGIVVDTGTVRAYMYQGSTGTLGATANITGVGTVTPTAPRYGNTPYATANPIGAKVCAVVEWKDLALDKTTLDTVSAYLLGTF